MVVGYRSKSEGESVGRNIFLVPLFDIILPVKELNTGNRDDWGTAMSGS